MGSRDGGEKLYRARINAALERARLSEAPLEASEKYDRGRALPFPGLTLISPAGARDPSAARLYQRLEADQRRLCQRFSDSLIPIRAETFHITGADLIAGAAYEREIASVGETRYHMQLREALAALSPSKRSRRGGGGGGWAIAGLSLFGSALVALLSPSDAESYQRLTGCRDEIYGASSLQALGVIAPRSLMAHITLAYFTEQLAMDQSQQDALQCELIEYNQMLNCDQSPRLALSLERLELCAFRDMEAYTPLEPRTTLWL